MRVAAFFQSSVDRRQHFHSFFHRTQLLLVLMRRQNKTTRALKEASKSKSIPFKHRPLWRTLGTTKNSSVDYGPKLEETKKAVRTDEGAKVLTRTDPPRRGPTESRARYAQTSDFFVTEAGRQVFLTGNRGHGPLEPLREAVDSSGRNTES